MSLPPILLTNLCSGESDLHDLLHAAVPQSQAVVRASEPLLGLAQTQESPHIWLCVRAEQP